MSRKFLTPIDLSTNELQNAVIQNLATAPTAIKGRLYFDSIANTLRVSLDGSTWSTINTGQGSFTLGSTLINLGSTTTTIAGLTSVTSTTFVGALTGNADTATKFATARTINGVSFDGSANIVVKASTTNALTIGTGLTGTSFDGSAGVTIALGTVGTAGTYTKVTTDAYGRVTAGTALSASDIPQLGNITNAGAIGSTSGLVVSTTASGVLTASSALPNGTTATTQPSGDSSTKVATTAYVDSAVITAAQGFNVHDGVSVATTTTLAAVYAAGSAGADGGTGVGATITLSSTGATVLDTNYTLATGDRVLVKDGITADAGTASKANGIYLVTTAGTTGVATILTRATDYDNSVAGEVFAGDMIFVASGQSQAGSLWVMKALGTSTTPHDGIKIGTDSIQFSQYASTTAYSGTNGVSVSGTTISGVNATTTTNGVASFPAAQFSVSSGAVTVANLSGSVITSGSIGYAYLPTTAAANSVATSIARKLTGAGTGTGTSIAVNHGFGQWVTAQLFDNSGNQVEVDVTNATTGGGTTTFAFATSQTLSNFTYVIVG
jgi:hypothetical protein